MPNVIEKAKVLIISVIFAGCAWLAYRAIFPDGKPVTHCRTVADSLQSPPTECVSGWGTGAESPECREMYQRRKEALAICQRER